MGSKHSNLDQWTSEENNWRGRRENIETVTTRMRRERRKEKGKASSAVSITFSDSIVSE